MFLVSRSGSPLFLPAQLGHECLCCPILMAEQDQRSRGSGFPYLSAISIVSWVTHGCGDPILWPSLSWPIKVFPAFLKSRRVEIFILIQVSCYVKKLNPFPPSLTISSCCPWYLSALIQELEKLVFGPDCFVSAHPGTPLGEYFK